MITIEPFTYTDTDYQTAITINAAVFNEPPDSLAEWKHDDETRDKAYPYYRDLVRRNETVIAYVETLQSQFVYHPQKYACIIYVHPHHDAPDIRPQVLAYTLERLRGQNLIALTSGMLDDKPEAMRFFVEYGFKRVAEEKLSKLDVIHFDGRQYKTKVSKVSAQGIEIVPLRQLQQDDPDWQQKLYDLEVTVNRDIPSLGEKHYPPFEEWCIKRLNAPTFDPDAWFVAVDKGHYVGQSQGSINREGDIVQLNTGVTTTRREYRRLGIATALKVHIIEYAQSQGVAEIFTTNDSQNPMYQLNLSLGFQPQPSWVRVEKALV